jgi:hypothetical protein
MKKPAGRPEHKPDRQSRDVVEALSGFGIPQDKISAVLGISLPTLHKHYANEISRGAAVVEANLVGNLLRLAKGSDGTALKAIMFSLQSRFGWSIYAPGPVEAKAEPLGKKEALAREAQAVPSESEWSNLLN